MVDRKARDQLAVALRRLAAGRITNDEFDDLFCELFIGRDDDPGLSDVGTFGWLHYSDLRTYRLRGRHALSSCERRRFARTILFLKTDQEYVYGRTLTDTCFNDPYDRFVVFALALSILVGTAIMAVVGSLLAGLVAAGFIFWLQFALGAVVAAVVRRRRTEAARLSAIDDSFWPVLDERASQPAYRFWPFADHRSYDVALTHPPFLCGGTH